MCAVARYYEDHLGIGTEILCEVLLIGSSETIVARVDDGVQLIEASLIAVVTAGFQIDVLVQIELGKCHRAGKFIAIAKEIVIADAFLGCRELSHQEVIHLLWAHLLRQITCRHVLSGLERDVAEHIKEVIVEHGTEETCMSQTLLRGRIGGIDSVDHQIGIADATIGNLPRVVDLIHRGTPVMTVQIDVSISPAHTYTGRNHILISTLLKEMIHAEPILYQIAVLRYRGTEQQ